MELRQLRVLHGSGGGEESSRGPRNGCTCRSRRSQPHVKSLESELGVRLLDRSNRGVALTPAGQVFYEEIRGVFRRLDQARLKARHAGQRRCRHAFSGVRVDRGLRHPAAGVEAVPRALSAGRRGTPRADDRRADQAKSAQAGCIWASVSGPSTRPIWLSKPCCVNGCCSPCRPRGVLLQGATGPVSLKARVGGELHHPAARTRARHCST